SRRKTGNAGRPFSFAQPAFCWYRIFVTAFVGREGGCMVSAVDLSNHKRLHLVTDAPGEPSAPPARTLSDRERRVFTALAEAAMPAGALLPAAGEQTLAGLEEWLSGVSPHVGRALGASAIALELSTVATHRKTFSSLPIEARMRILAQWEQSRSHAMRSAL